MTMLEITNLTKHYKKICALSNMCIEVDEGEIVALIGKNGAGKTTLLNCIAGNIIPDGGSINYKDSSLLQNHSKLNEFGLLIQANFFNYLNAFDNLALLLMASGETNKNKINTRVDEVLELVGLIENKKSYVKSFSFGMKQRLGLAQALVHNPGFLVLDEPFVGLDPLGKEMLKKTIIKLAKEKQVGVLFSSHDLYDVGEICDRIVMIDQGKKVFDDVFKYLKTYTIITDEIIPGSLKEQLERQFGRKIICHASDVQLDDAELLDSVLRILMANMNVTDIQISENSLYDYFKEETA